MCKKWCKCIWIGTALFRIVGIQTVFEFLDFTSAAVVFKVGQRKDSKDERRPAIHFVNWQLMQCWILSLHENLQFFSMRGTCTYVSWGGTPYRYLSHLKMHIFSVFQTLRCPLQAGWIIYILEFISALICVVRFKLQCARRSRGRHDMERGRQFVQECDTVHHVCINSINIKWVRPATSGRRMAGLWRVLQPTNSHRNFWTT